MFTTGIRDNSKPNLTNTPGVQLYTWCVFIQYFILNHDFAQTQMFWVMVIKMTLEAQIKFGTHFQAVTLYLLNILGRGNK